VEDGVDSLSAAQIPAVIRQSGTGVRACCAKVTGKYLLNCRFTQWIAMSPPTINCVQLSHHVLAIRSPERSLDFYLNIIGMALVATQTRLNITHYLLSFGPGLEGNPSIPDYPHCVLELVFDPERAVILNTSDAGVLPGYWKLALAVADLELARSSLVRQGISVTEPVQVPDVAYLCHCEDPDGYSIELIQHRMLENHSTQLADENYALGTVTSFSLVTCRVKNPRQSIDFYEQTLGLRLISRQQVAHRGFTLYFLSCDQEAAPSTDIDNIEMREWLWQRPYALLELQHIWGSELQADFAYRTDADTGFEKIRLLARSASSEGCVDPEFGCEFVNLVDPDGYRIQLLLLD
jgi:lactoylglutathione lyase